MQRLLFIALALAFVINGYLAIKHTHRNSMAYGLEQAFERGELEGLHSVLILHKGRVFAESYFAGEDQRWGTPIGRRRFHADKLHDLRSVTKSIVGLLYGIALHEGIVPSLDASLLSAFPEYADLAADLKRRQISVSDTLTMRMGNDWNEQLPYSNPRNSEIAMEMAPDRYRYILERSMIDEPGTKWVYNGGATAIIGRLIEKGAGMPLDEYAVKRLFEPLGIKKFEWVGRADGVVSAASGLRMTAPDLAKIGQLIVDGGRLGKKQVVPQDWINALHTRHTQTGSILDYSYFWWIAPGKGEPNWIAGFGNGGQRLSVNRDRGIVAVIFAGNYNKPDGWKLPVKVISDFLAPALKARSRH